MSRFLCLVMITFTFFCSVLAHPIPNDGSSLEKRSYEGRGTWFKDGLGACGEWNNDFDHIVALALHSTYDHGKHCNKWVHITVGHKSVKAQVRDACEACGRYDLDMSKSLFEEFAPLSKGVLKAEWYFMNS